MISEALRLLRVFHDMKQKELAEKLGLSRSYISEIESGNRTPSLEVIESYSNLFRVPVSSIMFFSESISSSNSTLKASERGKVFISSKILGFLKLVESKTELNDAT